MKIIYSRARQLGIAVFIYNITNGYLLDCDELIFEFKSAYEQS